MRGRQIHLPRKQFDLLKYLIAYRGNPVSRQVLSELVWGTDSNEHTENLRVLISQLRKMIESDPEHPRYILTEPRVGYRFESAPQRHTRRRRQRSKSVEIKRHGLSNFLAIFYCPLDRVLSNANVSRL